MIDDFVYNNEDESEMGQLHSIHLHLNALAAHLEKTKVTGPSLEFCEDCGVEIPQERRKYAAGCSRCITCQTLIESK